MSGSHEPTRYYYSSHHFVRDVIGTAAPLTLFLVAAACLLPEVRAALLAPLEWLRPMPDWWAAGIILMYLMVAYVTGAIMNRFILAYRLFRPFRRYGLDLTRFYKANAASILLWYRAYITECADLSSEPEPELVQYVDRLIGLFRIYNPAGYLHVYREYVLLFIYRQVIGYTAILLGVALACGRAAVALGVGIGGILIYVAATSGLRSAAEAEFNFIIFSATWLGRKGEDVQKGVIGGG